MRQVTDASSQSNAEGNASKRSISWWLDTLIIGVALIGMAIAARAEAPALSSGLTASHSAAMAYSLELARQSARAGDGNGMLLLYRMLSYGPLNYHAPNQQVDMQRYRWLASRNVSQRKLDIEALDSLYQAATLGLPDALYVAAYRMAETLGQENATKLQEFAGRLDPPQDAGLQQYLSVVRLQRDLGETLTSARAFLDVLPHATQRAISIACTKGQSALEKNKDYYARAVSLKISKPLSSEVFLPSSLPGFAQTLLIAGQWEEIWGFKACKKAVHIKVRFSADGMGGANFQIPDEPSHRSSDLKLALK